MEGKIKIVHYLNQFFGQLGGEEAAGLSPQIKEGPIGPGKALKKLLDNEGEIVATVICGDNYFAEKPEQVAEEIIDLLSSYELDVAVAGPSFNAGRYSLACGAFCKAIQERLNIPAVAAMFEGAPGAEIYRGQIYIVRTSAFARDMDEALASLTRLALKLARQEKIGLPSEEGYLPRPFRRNLVREKTGAERAVDMLLAKIGGKPFQTELTIHKFSGVRPAGPIPDLSVAEIALITTGGLTPKGNPDRIESTCATKYGIYDISAIDDLTSDAFEAYHGGYSPVYVNKDPDRLLPLDVMRELEREGTIGHVVGYFFSTAGCASDPGTCHHFGREISRALLEAKVSGAIITCT